MYRQQQGLTAVERIVPDLVIVLVNKLSLCDTTVHDALADSSLATASKGAGFFFCGGGSGREQSGKVSAVFGSDAFSAAVVCGREHGWAE